MCLDLVTKRAKTPTKKITHAWKVFKIFRGTLLSRVRYMRIKRGVWLRAQRDNWPPFLHYPFGFHCFLTYGDAATSWMFNPEFCVILKVEVRGVHTYGVDAHKDVLVAYEMRIPREKTARKKTTKRTTKTKTKK